MKIFRDGEFIRLARRAVDEVLNNEEIKKEIKNWKTDTLRA